MIPEDLLKETILESSSYREVARKLKVSHGTVNYYVKLYRIEKPDNFKSGKYLRSVGKTFNYLTIKSIEKTGRRFYCFCDCSCGKKEIRKRIEDVISGRVPSCGCISKNRPSVIGEKNGSFNGIGELRGSQFLKIKRTASRRGIEFKVTKEYIWQIYLKQEKKCALSGIPIKFGRVYFTHETTASLDRIDSTKAYEEGNLQWVHKDINKLKHDFAEEYFFKMCENVTKYRNRIEPLIEKELCEKGIEVTMYDFGG
jgi:hypothetical protein